MLTAAIAVALTAFVITTWLLTIASHAAPGTDQATARLDAVRTGLAAGAGAGAAVGLMLAFRRQHHQEIATLLTDLDATERRIIELYTKAVEQLGNDKAPVRLGGLYALERLAQDNSAQRPTIVNVICAYLRMPFAPAAPASKPAPAATGNATEPTVETKITTTAADDTWQQERQVRLAAQRILSEHLRKPAVAEQPADSSHTRFWPGIRLDLTDATLIDFSLANSAVTDVEFRGATFSGETRFGGATFGGDARFDGATFSGDARFRGATFSGDARFDGATFGYAGFGGATFSGYAGFSEAAFSGDARFGGATFNGYAGFGGATFVGDAGFGGATFGGDAQFSGATFNSYAGFSEATFRGDAGFDGATFNGDARFGEATFGGDAQFGEATFGGDTRFGGATFGGHTRFGGATFRDPDAIGFTHTLVRSSDGNHVWPTGWHLGDDGKGELTVVRANGSSSS